MHTVQLILRPALELLFEKQQLAQSSNREPMLEARLQDLILNDVASQCVLSAVQFNDFLGAQIQSQSFVCWWYNISR